MIPMHHAEIIVLNYLVNSLWQVPVIFLAATLAARLTSSAGPQTEHRLWVAALILEVALPACAFAPALRSLFSSLINNRAGHVTTQLTILNATAAHNPSHLGLIAESTALIAYAALLIYFTARLVYRLHRTHALRHSAQLITLTGDLLTLWQRCARIFAVHNAQLATSAAIAGPSTIGIRRRIVLLPPTLLTDLPHEDLAAALAHEFAHMRRRDFAKNLLYEFLALPIAWHPLLWLTRHRIAESREMVCDELAAHATHGTTRYAHALLRLAASFSHPAPAATLHTIGILDANVLERRVMKLTRIHPITATSRRAAIAAAVLLGLATCASAMSLRFELPAQAILSAHATPPAHAILALPAQEANGPIRVGSGVMAGQIVSKVNPVYPVEAKEQGIQGAVVLHAIIDKDGTVKELAVVSGPPELQASAIDAVKQWVYKPFLLNGNPVEVNTTITVNYSLDNSSAPPPPGDNTNLVVLNSESRPAFHVGNPAGQRFYISSNQTASQTAGPDAEVYNVGGSVRPPVLAYSVNPEYTPEARAAKLSGKVIVSMIVDSNGQPHSVQVDRGLGNELDQKAVEAVQQYRFKPATRNGEPVPVRLKAEVDFQLF